jgi:hypothetical protein
MNHKFGDYSIRTKYVPSNFFRYRHWLAWVYYKNELISGVIERNSESACLTAAAFDIKNHKEGLMILEKLAKN